MTSGAEKVERFRTRRRAEARALLGGRCQACGSEEELEFHHVDSTTKSFTISKCLQKDRETFFAEVAKCQLLCSDCHAEETRKGYRLTWAIVDEIRSLTGLTQAEIGRRYGIHQVTVSEILRGKRWNDRHRRASSVANRVVQATGRVGPTPTHSA